MRTKFTAWLFICMTGALALSIQTVDITSDASVTKITLTTDGKVMPQVELIKDELFLAFPGISNPSTVALPMPSGLAMTLKWNSDRAKESLVVQLAPQTGSYKAYATSKPDAVVLEIQSKVIPNLKTSLTPEMLTEPDFDVGKMGRTLLLDDDDGIDNGNLSAGVDVDWWYQRPMVYMHKEVETYIVPTGKHLPPAGDLAKYDTIIYYSGCDEVPLLLEEPDTASLKQYIINGGHLLMFCQNLFGVPAGVAFAKETLGISKFKEDTCVTKVMGEPGEEPLCSMDLTLLGQYRPIGNWSDGFILDASRKDCKPLLKGCTDGYIYAAVGNYGKGRLVLATFAQENLPDNLMRMRVIKSLLKELWSDSQGIK